MELKKTGLLLRVPKLPAQLDVKIVEKVFKLERDEEAFLAGLKSMRSGH